MLGFGTLSQIITEAADVTYNGPNLTVQFQLPQYQQLLVLGICTIEPAATAGNSIIVTELSHRGINRIIGDDVGNVNGAGAVTGVPLGDIAALGDQNFPWWPGKEAELERLLWAALPLNPARIEPYLADAMPTAWQSLRRVHNGNLDLAGFVVSENTLTLRGVDIGVVGTDRPTKFGLVCLVLGEEFDIQLTQWGQNGPWWLAYEPIPLAVTVGTAGADQQTIRPPTSILGSPERGASFKHLQTRATVFDDATLVPQPGELVNLAAGNATAAGTLSQFQPEQSALSMFAGANNLPLFSRYVWDKDIARWRVEVITALGGPSQVCFVDYMYSVAELREPELEAINKRPRLARC